MVQLGYPGEREKVTLPGAGADTVTERTGRWAGVGFPCDFTVGMDQGSPTTEKAPGRGPRTRIYGVSGAEHKCGVAPIPIGMALDKIRGIIAKGNFLFIWGDRA